VESERERGGERWQRKRREGLRNRDIGGERGDKVR
jgi:hypothetical protein